MMPPDGPEKGNSRSSVAGVTPPGVNICAVCCTARRDHCRDGQDEGEPNLLNVNSPDGAGVRRRVG
jgi:hypothetical protein